MFNTVFDSSATFNIILQILGGIALTITCLIVYCKKYWNQIKHLIIIIVFLVIFFGPLIILINCIIFGLLPILLDSYIYFQEPQEYKIQILRKKETKITNNTHDKKSKDINYTYEIYTHKWWDDKNKEIVNFEVSKDQYDKLYEKEYVYIKSYKGILRYQHLYIDHNFLRPSEEDNIKIKQSLPNNQNSNSAKQRPNKQKKEEALINPLSRIVSFNGNAEFKPINSDWKACLKTVFQGITSFKTKEISKIFISLPMDNSVKVKSNTEIEINPIVKIKKLDMTYVRLIDGNVIYSIAPNIRQTLITLVSNFEIYGNSSVYQIIYSRKTKKLEVIVKSGFVNIKMLNDDNRISGIGKSYKLEFNEIKETALDKINLDDYEWD